MDLIMKMISPKKIFHNASLILLFIVTVSVIIPAQEQRRIDSLKSRLISLNGVARVDVLNQLCWEYKNILPKDAITFGEDALRLADSLHYLAGEAQAFNNIGVVFSIQGNFPEALSRFIEVLKIRENLQDSIGIARSLNNIGIVYKNLNNYPEALKAYFRSLEIKRRLGDIAGEAKSYNNIGEIYQHQKKFNESLKYHQKSLEIEKKIGYEPGIASSLANIADIYYRLGRINQALKFHRESLSIEQKMDNKEGIGISYLDIATANSELKNFNEAILSAQKGLEAFKQIEDAEGMMNAHFTLASVYQKAGRFAEAYNEMKAYDTAKDSVFNSRKSQQIIEIQTKYETEKKENEIALLKKDGQLKEEMIKRQAYETYSLLAGLFLLLLFLLYYYRSNKKIKSANLLLKTQNDEIMSQKNEIIKQNEVLEELNIEKNNLIAIVAHDLRSPLVAVHSLSHLVSLDGPLNDLQNDYVKTITKVSDDGCKLITELLDVSALEEKHIPIRLETLNLDDIIKAMLPQYSKQAQSKGIRIEYHNALKSSSVYADFNYIKRIMDNLISNAIKFSPYHKKISINIIENKCFISISVTDEGPGISEEDKSRLFKKFQRLTAKPTGGEASNGLGLSIVKTLTERLGGAVSVETELNKGSSFIVTLPRQISGNNGSEE